MSAQEDMVARETPGRTMNLSVPVRRRSNHKPESAQADVGAGQSIKYTAATMVASKHGRYSRRVSVPVMDRSICLLKTNQCRMGTEAVVVNVLSDCDQTLCQQQQARAHPPSLPTPLQIPTMPCFISCTSRWHYPGRATADSRRERSTVTLFLGL